MNAKPELLDSDAVVVLSPHLDDAALSCGALLAQRHVRGHATTVLTVFDGAPVPPLSEAALRIHERCGLDGDAVATRMAEDSEALTLLGCDTIGLSHPEALYRQDERGRPLHAEIDASTPEREPVLLNDLSDQLREIPSVMTAEYVLAPLSIGNHIDHQIVGAAARLQAPQRPILWYEDVPYVLSRRGAGWERQLLPQGPMTIRFSVELWSMKLAAIECYRSQIPILWSGRHDWAQGYTEHVLKEYGTPAERYWGNAEPWWS